MNRVEQMKQIQATALTLFEKKNADYGDAFATYGSIGVLMRIGDKIQRALSITNRGIALVDDETIRDTMIDLHNYSAMALMLLDDTTDRSADDTRVAPCETDLSVLRELHNHL